jgi:hypothetical protein
MLLITGTIHSNGSLTIRGGLYASNIRFINSGDVIKRLELGTIGINAGEIGEICLDAVVSSSSGNVTLNNGMVNSNSGIISQSMGQVILNKVSILSTSFLIRQKARMLLI